jgi:hypothetical protein
MPVFLPALLLAVFAVAAIGWSQEADQAREIEAMQKKLLDVQGKSTLGAKESLKRRDLKGQAMSQGEPEGLTPEQKKMYEEIQQQLQQIKANRQKSEAALEELMKEGAGK